MYLIMYAFVKSNVPNEEINEQSFSGPHPEWGLDIYFVKWC